MKYTTHYKEENNFIKYKIYYSMPNDIHRYKMHAKDEEQLVRFVKMLVDEGAYGIDVIS